jgi:ATP-dependent RNA helicase DeaD
VRPGDLVGAIAGESGVDSSELGAIEIEQNFSLVEVPEARLEEIIAAMKRTTLRGRRVVARLFREVD